MLEVMAGPRYEDRFTKPLRRAVKGMRVGVSEFHMRDLDAAVQKTVEAALRQLEKLGCLLEDVRIPELDDAHQASIVISASEAVAFHDQFLKAKPEAMDRSSGSASRRRTGGAHSTCCAHRRRSPA